ncbi:MAG: hypothetical protein ACR2PO_14760 [Methyloligellaceae bacterium]
MLHRHPRSDLPAIPVYDVGRDWPMETLAVDTQRVHDLLDAAAAGVPKAALRLGDAVSRRWLARSGNRHLGEIDRVAETIDRPGAHYFNTSYEWGCTASVGPSPDGRTARLMRVLDWPDHGLGRYIVAVRVDGAAGPWITLTWPGYTGVLHALAPGRFAAALNQAPMDQPVGFFPLDWAVNRVGVWRSAEPTPAHLLRRAFEEACNFEEARRILMETPLALSTIYSLTGTAPYEACIIERREREAHVIEGPASAANQWQRPDWRGRGRGVENDVRACMMADRDRELDPAFPWLAPPVLNETTRLALVADAGSGRMVVQGYEADGPATQTLSLHEDVDGPGMDALGGEP